MLWNRLLMAVAILVAAAATFTLWERRDNGRYAYFNEEGSSMRVGDTRTGTLFVLKEESFMELHPQTGTGIMRKLKPSN